MGYASQPSQKTGVKSSKNSRKYQNRRFKPRVEPVSDSQKNLIAGEESIGRRQWGSHLYKGAILRNSWNSIELFWEKITVSDLNKEFFNASDGWIGIKLVQFDECPQLLPLHLSKITKQVPTKLPIVTDNCASSNLNKPLDHTCCLMCTVKAFDDLL